MGTSKVFIITGNQGEGKTTFLKRVLYALNEARIKTAGFYAEGKWENDLRTQFYIVDIQNNDRKLLCCDKGIPGFEKVGRFYFDPETIQWGENMLEQAKQEGWSLFVLDEIGKFELEQKVWFSVFFNLLTEKRPVLITVRKEILEAVIQYFRIHDAIVFGLDSKPKVVARKIIAQLNFL